MSLGLVAHQFTRYESNISVPASPIGTQVASGGSAHTKNTTYTELIASTAFDTYWIEIVLGEVSQSSVNTAMLVDIAIGAAASETVIIPNLNAGMAAGSGAAQVGADRYCFPLYIPAASRLSATAQGAVTSDTLQVSVWLYGAPTEPAWAGQQVVAYGVDLATSRGVTVAAGLSAAEGSWTEIASATSQDHSYICAGIGGAGDTSHQSSNNVIDLGIGAATEVAIIEGIPWWGTTSEAISFPWPIYSWCQVPSGTRLAARISSNQPSSQSYDVVMYGVS